MVHVPNAVAVSELSKLLEKKLRLLGRGKVRDTYELPGGKLLVVATDRISIFDFVLGCLIAGKGEILTAITAYWLTGPLKTFSNHLIAAGAAIDEYLPKILQGRMDLQKRSLVVQNLVMAPIEAIVRGYLTGSGLKAYVVDGGRVCGIQLPSGLHDGSKLEKSIFTPTTKEEVGHDVPLDRAGVCARYDWMEQLSLNVFTEASAHLASSGFLLVDTKFEFGTDAILADEVVTPDSSRICLATDYDVAQQQGRMPASFDKQGVRQYGLELETPFDGLRIDKLSPENAQHIAFADRVVLPETIVRETVARYRRFFHAVTRTDLESYQTKELGIGF